VNWGNTLHDPVVGRITRNVLNRLASPVNGWEVIGPGGSIRALTVCDSQLYGVGVDDSLYRRDVSGQNLRWHRIDSGGGVIAMATPREASTTRPIGLYGLTGDDKLVYRDPGPKTP
jgi:hypothetical protein